MYERVLRPFFFALDPESAHHLALAVFRGAGRWWPKTRVAGTPATLFGLHFRHPVGLAAGFDKNGVALPMWEALGFSFAEIGTVTARAQPGNPRPRIFRYPAQRALINRLGFNNDGADVVARRLTRLRQIDAWPKIPIGINLGKSRATALEDAVEDYRYSYRQLSGLADYVVLNVSSPNTPGLRDLQHATQLEELLRAINRDRRGIPLLVKIAPDLPENQLADLLEVCQRHQVSGIIATNTTLDHSSIAGSPDEAGGLSGAPLRGKSTAIIHQVAARTDLPIIGCGGIFDAESAREKLAAGASLLQVYTGFIYRGPALVREIAAGTIESVAH